MINIDGKKVKEHTGFHYLLTEIQLYTLIPLELNTSTRTIKQNQR